MQGILILPSNKVFLTNADAAHFMLTASHGPDETLADAVLLAGQLSECVGSGPVEVIEF